MNKAFKLTIIVVILSITMILSITSVTLANSDDGPYSPGPAPSAGDGELEGPEWGADRPDGSGPGSAPNSGDGIPDGPGW